jgi:hypothetical protein
VRAALALALVAAGCGGSYLVRTDDLLRARAASAVELPARRVADQRSVEVLTASVAPAPAPPRTDGFLFVHAHEIRNPRARRPAFLISGLAVGAIGISLTAAGTVFVVEGSREPPCTGDFCIRGLTSALGGLMLAFGVLHDFAAAWLLASYPARR